jgi:hypothetical protein
MLSERNRENDALEKSEVFMPQVKGLSLFQLSPLDISRTIPFFLIRANSVFQKTVYCEKEKGELWVVLSEVV